MPTSSANKLSQTHPIYVSNKKLKFDYYVIHNGIITNEDELREEHIKEGFIYTTDRINSQKKEEFNDSEAFAIELAKYHEGLTKEVGSTGSIAFTAVKVNKKTSKAISILYGRTTNPLNLDVNGDYMMLSSEGPGDEIESKRVFEYNLATKKTESYDFRVKEYIYKGSTEFHYGYNSGVKSNAANTWPSRTGYQQTALPTKTSPVEINNKEVEDIYDEGYLSQAEAYGEYDIDQEDETELTFIDEIILQFRMDVRDEKTITRERREDIIDSALLQIRNEMESIADRAEKELVELTKEQEEPAVGFR